jgi:hypothetical protein
VCAGGHPGSYDGTAIERIRGPFVRLHGLVVNLIETTMPAVRIFNSDRSRWRVRPPS